jgi:hypothetical protein
LAQFKAENPHDMIRMYESGIEGYILFSDRMLRNVFFYDLHNLSNWTALFSTWFGALGKVGIGLVADSGLINVDGQIKTQYKNDGGEELRELSGFPSLNWVYDLFRPNEPYANRGIHPSGDGIARYITWEQLNDDEKQYLIKQGWLNYLNFISPLLYGFNTFPLGSSGFEGNFAFHHYLTPFGSDVPAQIFLKKAPVNMLFTYHSYQNYNNYFPAIEAELVEYPIRLTPKFDLLLSPRIARYAA